MDERYLLVLHARGVKEALIGAADIRDIVIMKRDGRNEERRGKFMEEYLNINAEIRVPQVVSDVEGLLCELFKVAQARIKAESAVRLSQRSSVISSDAEAAE